MDKQRWQQIESIYFAALALGVKERSAYLEVACADAELRGEVEALLRSEEELGDFLEQPALAEVKVEEIHDEEQTRSLSLQPELRRIGPYKLLTPLGKGGMGEVYLALDTRLQRKAAIKLLPAQFTHEPDRVRRFAQEARAASALNHPNILTIYEIGKAPLGDSSVHYIATEFVEGETLRQQMTAPITLAQALDWGMQITTALAAAHEAGIIHRDIKPENTMVRRDGLVKVLDFGLAKLTEAQNVDFGFRREEAETLPQTTQTNPQAPPQSTASGIVIGTPRYMSPEQARGLRVDARTDLFSLGVLLYEMLAGKPPFTGHSPMDVISEILTVEPESLHLLRPDVPARLSKTIHRLLHKDREQRPATAQELRDELKACQTELTTPTLKTPVSFRRKWLAVSLIAAASLVLLGSWWLLSRAPASRPPLRSEFSEMFLDLGRWQVPPSGWEIRDERLLIANQTRVGFAANINADDFTMTFHLKLESAAGAAWALRIRDQDNYYLFYLSGADGGKTGTSYFSTYIVRDGKLGDAVSRIPVTKKLSAGGEYTVNITAKGTEITHLLNSADDPSTEALGDPLGYFKDDNNVYPSGGIGFRSVGTERFSVDELYVRPLSLQSQ